MAPDYHWLTTPVSASVSVRVFASGRIKAKHIRNLMRTLAIDLEVLEEDEHVPCIAVPTEEMPR